jgi:hypothetical protein
MELLLASLAGTRNEVKNDGHIGRVNGTKLMDWYMRKTIMIRGNPLPCPSGTHTLMPFCPRVASL